MRDRVPNYVLVSRRIFQLRSTLKVDTQQLRVKTLRQLEQLFETASAIARGQIQWQQVNGKNQAITLKHRQMWARVAAYIAQIMNNIANGFDEKQIDEDLIELQRIVNEANTKGQAAPVEGAAASQSK